MFRRALLSSIVLATPLAGCAPYPVRVPVVAALPAAPAVVRVSGRLALDGLDLPGGRRRVQLVQGWQPSDVTTFKVYLRRDGGDERSLGDLPGGATSLELADLQPSTPYLVRLEAYADAERIDVGGAPCETSFTTTTSPELTGVVFQVKLDDVVLPVETEGNLEITDGVDLTNG